MKVRDVCQNRVHEPLWKWKSRRQQALTTVSLRVLMSTQPDPSAPQPGALSQEAVQEIYEKMVAAPDY